jgi:hypothetical protein
MYLCEFHHSLVMCEMALLTPEVVPAQVSETAERAAAVSGATVRLPARQPDTTTAG